MPAELNTTAGGRALLREIDDYLEEFGWRSDAFELADPTWREDISIPMKVLRGLVALDDESDPDRLAREAVSVREALVDNALKVLGGNGDKLSTFRDLYASAVCYVGITEDHNFYIDQLGSAVLRLPLVELGRRLANRGALLDESDVFYIYVSEIRDGLQGTDFKDHVAQRKGEIEK